MELKITARNTKLSEAIKEKVQHKFNKLKRYSSHITSCEIVLSEDKQETYFTDLNMKVEHQAIIIKEHDKNLYKSLDNLFKKAERQLKRIKGKQQTFTHEKVLDHLEEVAEEDLQDAI